MGRLTALLATGGLVASMAFGVAAPPADAALVVTETADEDNVDGDCSLREAVQTAATGVAHDACVVPADGVVSLGASTYQLDAHLDVDGDVVLAGAGAADTMVQCGPAIVTACIRNVGPATDLTVSRATVAGGPLTGIATFGTGELHLVDAAVRDMGTFGVTSTSSAIHLERSQIADNGSAAISTDEGPVTVRDSVLSGNLAGVTSLVGAVTVERSTLANTNVGIHGEAGPIEVLQSTIHGHATYAVDSDAADVTVVSSTLARNLVHGLNTHAGHLEIHSSTIAENGIRAFNFTPDVGSARVTNSILANEAEECDNVPESGGWNLTDDTVEDCHLDHPTDRAGVDVVLGTLGGNGGPTATYLPLEGSPAIDGGADCLAQDQRGEARPTDGDHDGLPRCDVGAVEVAGPTESDGSGGGTTSAGGARAQPATPVRRTPSFTG